MSEKILVVEDEEDMAKLIRINLENKGYAVTAALSGAEALEIAAAEKPDLILLDIVLPDTTGFKVCQKIKQDIHPSAKVIIYTGKIDAVDAMKARESGADDFTAKTEDLIYLMESIQKILQEKDK